MGYNTWVSGTLEVYPDKANELVEVLKEHEDEESFEYLCIDAGSVSFPEHHHKMDPFISFDVELGTCGTDHLYAVLDVIRKYISYGHLFLDGDDSEDKAKIEFDGGDYVIARAEFVYGDLVDHFLKVYDEELPEDLKERLIQWHTARQV